MGLYGRNLQAKLAEKVNTSTHYIGMIETKNNFPSPEMLERIAKALGIDTVDLFIADITMSEKMKNYQKNNLSIPNLIQQAVLNPVNRNNLYIIRKRQYFVVIANQCASSDCN